MLFILHDGIKSQLPNSMLINLSKIYLTQVTELLKSSVILSTDIVVTALMLPAHKILEILLLDNFKEVRGVVEGPRFDFRIGGGERLQ